jgi:hypothetical protein
MTALLLYLQVCTFLGSLGSIGSLGFLDSLSCSNFVVDFGVVAVVVVVTVGAVLVFVFGSLVCTLLVD